MFLLEQKLFGVGELFVEEFLFVVAVVEVLDR